MNKIIVNADIPKGIVKRELYGSFSEHLGRCVYEGFYVGEDSDIPNTNGIRLDVVEMLKELEMPLLRWPGGCFADAYHWKDGIGPKSERPSVINIWWGGENETNHFGTHEFYDLCEMLGAAPYTAGNVGSGTIRDMQEWIEYTTMPDISPMANLRRQNGRDLPWDLKYFGVGNENWGCGGNMTAEYYANEYKRYATYVRQYNKNPIYKIASGSCNDDYHWTDVMMREAKDHFDGISLHYYTIPLTGDFTIDKPKGDAQNYDKYEWERTIRFSYHVEKYLKGHIAVMDRYDPECTKGLILDEWGTWFDPKPCTNAAFLHQENTIRDAIVAAIHFNIFHKYNKRLDICTIAQTINVLQSVLITEGYKIKRTPTYYAFLMYKKHFDNEVIDSHTFSETNSVDDIAYDKITQTATKDKDNNMYVTLSNVTCDEVINVDIDIRGVNSSNVVEAEILTSNDMNKINNYGNEEITIKSFDNYSMTDNKVIVIMPPMSIVSFKIKAD